MIGSAGEEGWSHTRWEDTGMDFSPSGRITEVGWIGLRHIARPRVGRGSRRTGTVQQPLFRSTCRSSSYDRYRFRVMNHLLKGSSLLMTELAMSLVLQGIQSSPTYFGSLLLTLTMFSRTQHEFVRNTP